ncbi:MAG TPA: histidine phosphatase family protein [Bacteroidales bacterium]|nr:histidine phosphatase family protein [Bacteroidales bacterium]
MKFLYLIRHAKSSWDEPGTGDAERPLLKKGIDKTRKVIRFLNDRSIKADLIISSPAVRAFETAKLVAAGTGYPESGIRIEKAIYEGDPAEMAELISGTPDKVGSLMVFGHNPSITGLANRFIHPAIEMLPTTGVVCISFDTGSWDKISTAKAVKSFVVYPKMLE